MSASRSGERDRAATEAALLAAVGEVVGAEGIEGLGVNVVARAAGVDKVLIYRYFNDLTGLVEAWATSPGFWPTLEELVPDLPALRARALPDRAVEVARRYVCALRRRPAALAILGGELTKHVPSLHVPLEQARERLGLALLAAVGDDAPPGVDLQAYVALVTAGLNYLLARSRFVKLFGGLRLDHRQDWERLYAVVGAAALGLFPPPQRPRGVRSATRRPSPSQRANRR